MNAEEKQRRIDLLDDLLQKLVELVETISFVLILSSRVMHLHGVFFRKETVLDGLIFRPWQVLQITFLF